MNTRALLITATALLAIAGCGSTASAKPAAHAAPASTTAPAVAPYDKYLAADTAAGIAPGVQRTEAVSVAGNTCDNTVDDMAGLVGGMQQLYTGTELQNQLTDRANFIDAYCPSARVIYDAATQQVVGTVVAASH